MATLRPSFPAPAPPSGAANLPAAAPPVKFLHPGYNDNGNLLATLLALDHPQRGIHHETARVACAILANNRWDGYLSESATGEALQAGPEEILRGTQYYFHVPADNQYAVVPSFSNWQFPRTLPQSWQSYHIPPIPQGRQIARYGDVPSRDISCRLTNHIESAEHAHLVPRKEEDWFQKNVMSEYATSERPGTNSIDCTENGVLLRSDVHTLFDAKRFAFVVKSSSLVVHVVADWGCRELSRLYQNVQLHQLYDVAIEYVFARFAWTIFPAVNIFLRQQRARKLVIRNKDGNGEVKDLTPQQYSNLVMPPSTSRSPSKRSRSQSQDKGPGDECLEGAYNSPEEEREEDHDSFEDEGPRGRTR